MKIYCYFVPKYTFVAERRVFKVGEEYPVYIQEDYFTLVAENGEFNLTKKASTRPLKIGRTQLKSKWRQTMFNYSSEIKWIRVTDIDGGLVWINLEKVERIYRTSDGSIFEFANTVIQTIVPFEKIPELLSGGTA